MGREPELSLEAIRRFASSLGPMLWILFGGGETFLRSDLEEISEIFYKHCKPSIVTYTTNGFLTETIREKMENILKAMPQSVVVVKLSLDGIGADHDDLRRKIGSFDKVMKTFQLLGDLSDAYPNLELGFNTVFCSANQYRMLPLITFVQQLKKARTHTISMVRGELIHGEFNQVDLNQYKKTIHFLEASIRSKRSKIHRFTGARLKAAQDILQRRLIYRTLVEKRRILDCFAGKLNLVLTETGDVYPCELSSHGFGNIREHGFDLKQLLRSPRANHVLRDLQRSACHCSHECYFITNILFNPRTYPELLRSYLEI
jgi:radical SAM protein with 4Fe4S-binding SPASM domain